MSTDRRASYADLTREELEERLVRAEDVCVLVAWTAVRAATDRDHALTQLWMEWGRHAGPDASSRSANPHLSDAEIHDLAEQRREIRRNTLARIGARP